MTEAPAVAPVNLPPASRVGAALDLYRRTTESRTALALVVANGIPLLGVLFFGWSLWTILVLYWVENGIVGLWTIPRILMARGLLTPGLLTPGLVTPGLVTPASTAASTALASTVLAPGSSPATSAMASVLRASTAIFFVFHYGLFWAVHGVFVLLLPSLFGGFSGVVPNGFPGLAPMPGSTGFEPAVIDATSALAGVAWSSVAIGAVALLLSHGASFFLNYVRRGEYLRTTPMAQAGAPYGRVVVLHVTILLGGFAIAFLGAPIGALIVLVILKTAFDLGLHLRQHSASFRAVS